MFIQHTNLPLQPPIKIYLRLKDKKSFPLSLKQPIHLADLKQLIVKKTKISQHDLIVMHQGNQIHFSNLSQVISFKDKSILHIINKKNMRNDFLQIQVKFILRNDEKACLGETKLFAKCQESIKEFIHSKVVRVIQERTDEKICQDDLSLILNGTVLKKNLNFHNYFIEDGSEIICMINNCQALQKSVNNISSHKIIVSHQQKLHEFGRRQIKSEHDPKSSPLQLSPHKRKSQVEKKPSLGLSQNRSEEFMKLETFESKHQLAEKQRLFNEALQHQNQGKKLKKKLKITSDLARKFQHQCEPQLENKVEEMQVIQLQSSQQEEKLSPTANILIPSEQYEAIKQHSGFKRPSIDFSNLENRNQSAVWREDPDSPIDVQYPPIERRGPSQVQWDPTTVSESFGQKSDIFEPFDIASQKLNEHKSQFQDARSLPEHNQGRLQIGENDFFIFGSPEYDGQKNTKDRIDELSQKFTNLIKQQETKSDNSAIAVEYPKLEKKGEPKMGDFLISGSLSRHSENFIDEKLVNKFKELIDKINIKRMQDYGFEEKQKGIEKNENDIPNQVNPENKQSD